VTKFRELLRSGMLVLLGISLPVWAAEDDHDSGGPAVDADLTAFYDSNVTLAELDDDIDDDGGVEASATWTWSEGGLQGKSTAWNVGVTGVKFDKFEDLDRLELSAGWKYVVQFERGFHAPIYEVAVDAKVIDTVSDIRDGWELEARVMMTRRLTERLVGRLGGTVTQRKADGFEVFDNKRINLFVNADLRASRQSVFYGTYILSAGDVVSTARPTLDIIQAAEKIEPDDAFGGVNSNRFAYRLDAIAHIGTIGWNRALAPNRSMDLSLRGLAAFAEGDIDYEQALVRLSYLHRF